MDASKISFPPKNVMRPVGASPPVKLLAVKAAEAAKSPLTDTVWFFLFL
jgi:hypothetical protein